MGNSDYEAARRILELVRSVERGMQLTSKHVQEKFSVKRAAAARYMKIVAEHVGASAQTLGGRKVVRKARSTEAALTAVIALEFAVRSLGWLRRTPYHVRLKELVADSRGQLTGSQQDEVDRLLHSVHFKDRQPAGSAGRSQVVDRVLRAMRDRKRCRIEYRKLDGTENSYLLDPWALAVVDNSPYLIAGKVPGGESRSFALSDVRRANVEDAAFTSPSPDESDPAGILQDTIGSYASSYGDPQPIVLQVRSHAAVVLDRRPLHAGQVVERTKDGAVTVRCSMVICPELVAAVLSLLPDVRVVSPATLRDQVRDAAAVTYGSDWDP